MKRPPHPYRNPDSTDAFPLVMLVLMLAVCVAVGDKTCTDWKSHDPDDRRMSEAHGPLEPGKAGSRDPGTRRGANPEVPQGLQAPHEDFTAGCGHAPPEDFNRLVAEAGEAQGVNPRLIALTVYRESKCDSLAVGAAGEIGLGQVYPAIWTNLLIERGVISSVGDLYDPGVNLRATAFVLSEANRTAKGDPSDALRRYNGSGRRARAYAQEQSARYEALWGEPVWFRR
jgi:hypothetical protein